MALKYLLPLFSLLIFSCSEAIPEFSEKHITSGFDYPVGKPDGKGYVDKQSFTVNNHLGEDWNGVHGGNSDLGDPIYAIANGYVSYAKDAGYRWGNIVKVIHKLPNGKMVESLYAHCDKIIVKKGDWVSKGYKIATIGTANGEYLAHLHFEIRDDIGMSIGGGYSSNTDGYIHPTQFIKDNR